MLKLAAGAAVIALFAFGVGAQTLHPLATGNGFLRFCERKARPAEDQYAVDMACIFYLQGVEEASGSYMLRGATPRWCVRDYVDGGQLLELMLAYLQKTPRRRDLASADLYMEAMVEVFPCKQP